MAKKAHARESERGRARRPNALAPAASTAENKIGVAAASVTVLTCIVGRRRRIAGGVLLMPAERRQRQQKLQQQRSSSNTPVCSDCPVGARSTRRREAALRRPHVARSRSSIAAAIDSSSCHRPTRFYIGLGPAAAETARRPDYVRTGQNGSRQAAETVTRQTVCPVSSRTY